MPADGRLIFSVFRGAREQHRTHREVLHRLRREREAASRASQEYRAAFVRARIQARREGRRLLEILDRIPRSA